MACFQGFVKLYCPRTGRLCQDIPPVVGFPGNPLVALLRRENEGGKGKASGRSHFLLVHRGRVCVRS